MLSRAIVLRFLVPALGLGLAVTGCDRRSASALVHADVPPLSVPVQAAPLAAATPAPSASAAAPAPDAPPGAHAAADDSPSAEHAAPSDADEEPSLDDEPARDDSAHASRDGSGRRRRRGKKPHVAAHASADGHGTASDDEDDDLRVARVAIARRVAHREPVGRMTSIKAGDVEKVTAFVEVKNPSREPSSITVALVPDAGGPAHEVTLDVGAEPRFRTWANLRAPRAPGSYHVIVRDDRGRVLARTSLRVTP